MRAEAPSRFGLFSLLLASALLLHQLWWGGFEVSSVHFAVVVAALWVLLRPASVVRLAVLLGVEVAVVAREMPAVHSHTLLVLVVGACGLAYGLARAVRERGVPDGETLFEAAAPFLRASVLVVYAAAGFAKLNSGFLDPALSCARSMTAQVAWFDPALLAGAEWAVVPAIAGSVAIELSLPMLLAFGRTRTAGLVLGGAFHAVLALAGNVPFSSLMLALYVAFLPAGAVPRGLAAWRAPALALPLLCGSWVAAAALLDGRPELGRALVEQGTRLAVVSLVAGGAVLLLRARGRTDAAPVPARPAAAAGGLRLGHPIFIAGIAVLAANALSPYVGFKTESSFAMFSNLRTEPGRWNHLLVPEAVRVLGYQDELVAIAATNDPALRRRGTGGRRLVRYELERYLRLRPASRAVYAGGPARTSPATPLLDKVAKFRDVRGPGC